MKHYALLLAAALGTTSLIAGGKEKKETDLSAPHHVELSPDLGIYKGVVTDGMNHTAVTKISFAGETEIDGIRKESDNSSNRVSLADIVSLEVLNPLHESARYPKQEFARVAVRTTANDVVEELLFPRHLLICAQSRDSQIKKSWFLHSITNISVHHGLADPVMPVPAHQQQMIPVPSADMVEELLDHIAG